MKSPALRCLKDLVLSMCKTRPALRKSLLRLVFKDRICIRELKAEDDFRQYFALRYRVWKQMGYLPPEQDCAESQWELNFTDRTAYPLGAFTREGELISCARLVLPLGQDSHHLRLIESLVSASGDRKLKEVFQYPERLVHPYDLSSVSTDSKDTSSAWCCGACVAPR